MTLQELKDELLYDKRSGLTITIEGDNINVSYRRVSSHSCIWCDTSFNLNAKEDLFSRIVEEINDIITSQSHQNELTKK